jgi:hypothetical protein
MSDLSGMISSSRSSFRFKRCLAALAACVCLVSASCFAQTTFLTVASTPYDQQMAPVWVFLNADNSPGSGETSLSTLNDWMRRLRAMPYRYSKQWKTPAEVNSDRMGDCKGKAVALYEKLLVNGAYNVRLVIGKHRANDLRTHAWVEWETLQGTLLLDPTLNWTVTKTDCQDKSTYIPLYAYENGRKYRALNSALIAKHNSLSDQVASRE